MLGSHHKKTKIGFYIININKNIKFVNICCLIICGGYVFVFNSLRVRNSTLNNNFKASSKMESKYV